MTQPEKLSRSFKYVDLIVIVTGSSAIAERPRCRVNQFWSKVKDDILQTI